MALETVTSGFYEGLSLTNLERHILWELGQVTGTTTDFGRFPKWLIRQKLNDRQNKFVFQSQCIKKFALLVAKEDYRRYKLPVNCMDGGILSAKYYDSSTSYQNLEIVDWAFLDDRYEGWLVEDSSTPEYVIMGDMYGNIPMIDVHPRPDSDGTTYTDGTDTGIAVGADMPSATNNVTGNATGGGATTLTDTGATFESDGLAAGMYVVNVSDNSSAPILTIDSDTQITLASALTGGTANSFSAGDSYNVLAGEYGVVTSWDDDDQILFGASVGLLSSITVPDGNFRVDYIPYPQSFPDSGNDDQKPEIPKLYHMDLAMGVVADFLRGFHEKSREFKRAQYYEGIFTAAVQSASSMRKSRPFDRKPVAFRPRTRR